MQLQFMHKTPSQIVEHKLLKSKKQKGFHSIYFSISVQIRAITKANNFGQWNQEV